MRISRVLALIALGGLLIAETAPRKPVTSTVSKKRPSPARKKVQPKKPTTSTARKAPARKTTARKAPSRKASSKTAPSKKSRRPGWRAGQQAPTPDRYKEIQLALRDKGYLAGPATGVWGQDSVAALKKFQQDQNLEPSGKLDALSLIALGLGPKRELTASSKLP